MNTTDVRQFAEAFCSTERKVWDSNFTTRDDMAHMMATMPLVKLYAKGMDPLIKRPPSPDANWFEGYGAEQAAKVHTRELFAVALVSDGGVFYTSAAGHNAMPGRLQSRLWVRDTAKGRRVVGTARVCPSCHGADPSCGECGGSGWKHAQGERLEGAQQSSFEVVAEPSLINPAWTALMQGAG